MMEERESGGISLTSTELEMVHDLGGYDNQKIGLRFNAISVPQGATVNSASISFRAEGSTSYGADLSIQAQNADDAAQFLDATGNLTNRSSWTSSVDWLNLQNWTGDSTYDSPDLSSTVQTVFNRPGWSPGNSLVFKVTGPSGHLGGRGLMMETVQQQHSCMLSTRQCKPCTANRSITANEWAAFALPCDPGSASTVEDIFTVYGGLVAADYGTAWVVYRFDATDQSYHVMGLSERAYPGRGYWVYSYEPTTVVYTGTENMTGDLDLETNAVDGQWNFVGYTENAIQAWGDFQAYNGSTLVDVSVAGSGCELVPPSDQCLVSSTGYVWTGGNYDPYNPLVPGLDDDVAPGIAIWVQAFKPGTMLRIEPPAASAPEEASALQSGSAAKKVKSDSIPSRKDEGSWFVRLVAESGSMQDHSDVLGQLHNSVDGLDSNDIKELAPFGHKAANT